MAESRPPAHSTLSYVDAALQANYDPIDHLNSIFSHPTTLSSAPEVSRALRIHNDALGRQIEERAAVQAISDLDSVNRIRAAQHELAELLIKIEGVRQRALHTEQTITDMTADIKRLDGTKRNLTLSMTMLKRLQMLTNAYEQLQTLVKSRQYRECAQLLQAVLQLMAHFKSYRTIDQIAALARKVAELQTDLLEQISQDFETAFANQELASKRGTLADACGVLDALGDQARTKIVSWYCNTSLKEYRQVFRGNDEAGSLDNISRRYAWFSRLLKTYDVEHAPIFPPHWRVNEMLANAFCEGTRDDFKGILQRSARRADGQTLNVNLLLSCLQETLDFENSLERRFVTASRTSTDTMTSSEDKSPVFHQAISEAFEPYLSLWVEAQDKHLAALIPEYRRQPLRNTDEDFSPQLVIPSSTELFQSYRLMLAQCAKLSTGNRLLELSKTFAKYLDQYSQQVLFYSLGDRFGNQGPSIEDTITVLNTADYCYTTSTQLEEKIQARIDADLKPIVDLQSQADAFMGIAGAAVRALVRIVEVACEPGWREMRNTPWGTLENVGDHSSYIGELVSHIQTKSIEILGFLHKAQYARAFCDQVVDAMTNAFIANLATCRPISEVGAEQMLLDIYVLKKAFTDLPILNNPQKPPPPPQPAYVKRVNQIMSKVDPLLKTLQVRTSPPEALVQAYLIHIADASEANFRKILDLKGVLRKQDQAALVELFNAHRAGQDANLVASSPLIATLNMSATPAPPSHLGSAVSASASTTNLASGPGAAPASKFDAASFGSALLSAARDGVGAAQTAAQGASHMASSASASSVPSRVATPAQGPGEPNAAANLNDNLRNIGKFFRRDMTGFGRFGGAGTANRI